jgi:hypothetical protein
MSSGSSKRVVYRGGIASFDLPASWVEEYEAAGGGTFYEDRPDSGTLRLNVLGFDSESTPAQEMAVSALKGRLSAARRAFHCITKSEARKRQVNNSRSIGGRSQYQCCRIQFA